MNPSLISPLCRYRELNARRRSREEPSVPEARDGGKLIHGGREEGGAGPGC